MLYIKAEWAENTREIMEQFSEDFCLECEHCEKWVSNDSFHHAFGCEVQYSDHVTCTHEGGCEDPSDWSDCPIMYAEYQREVAANETSCPITCKNIRYMLLEDGEALRAACRAEKCHNEIEIKKGA